MKTRYFVKENFCFRPKLSGMELIFDGEFYAYKDDNAGVTEYAFTSKGGDWEKYVVKVEEMELSDFIADGRTKYELNGIRFVVTGVSLNNIMIKTDMHCIESGILKTTGSSVGNTWIIYSRHSEIGKNHNVHIEDIKLVTTCVQCGKDEIQDAGLCSDCISKLPKIESRKVVDIHQNENGSFSVGSVVNVCEHDEIVYTNSQYIEAIEKEVPELSDVRNKYDVQIVGKDGVKTTVDVYRVLNAFEVHDAATQHAIKKLLAAGKRRHKDYVQDLKEAIASIELSIVEWEQTNV